MDIDSIIKFLLIGGVIQGFGFNLVTLFIKKKFTKVIVFLNLVVLFISLNNLQRILIDKYIYYVVINKNHKKSIMESMGYGQINNHNLKIA